MVVYLLVDVTLSVTLWVTRQIFGGLYYLTFGSYKTKEDLLLIEMQELRKTVEELKAQNKN